ncbi:MAG: hypothetical protein EBZ77_16850 [Chitinophagia bacterium]|nr:hypothetical protein [Chitinophagia bacterium]
MKERDEVMHDYATSTYTFVTWMRVVMTTPTTALLYFVVVVVVVVVVDILATAFESGEKRKVHPQFRVEVSLHSWFLMDDARLD